MNYLLDTCIVSELVKPKPSVQVLSWLGSVEEDRLFLSVLTLGEIRKGIARLHEGEKRVSLERWVREDLRDRFADRLLTFDAEIAFAWGETAGRLEREGKRAPAVDGMIAATAKIHGLTVVTRNTPDLAAFEVPLLNPWETPLPKA